MHITGKQIAIGLGVAVGAVGLAIGLAACAPKEQDAESFALGQFGRFDREPKDNQWTAGEVERTTIEQKSQIVDTYRVGDARFGTRQYLQRTNTSSMSRIYQAAKGNDAVLSLEELRNFALGRYDADQSGTLNKDERNAFQTAFGPTSRLTQWVVTGTAPYVEWDYYDNDYNYPSTPGGGTSHGDDPIFPGSGGTSHGDDSPYVPPSNGGTSPGDSGGHVPPSNGGSSGGNGNSTDNGNPSDDDF